MSTKALEKAHGGDTAIAIDREAVLRHLDLDPRQPATQALVLTCQEYGLDPVLGHMVLIQSKPYITHKGLWHIAHRSELLNGEEVTAQGEDATHWFATVSIYRKDWDRAVTMTGRYPKGGTNKNYGPEMAVTRAECLVLRRLFDIAVAVKEEIDWPTNAEPEPPASPPPALSLDDRINAFVDACVHAGLDDEAVGTIVHVATQGRTAACNEITEDDFGSLRAAFKDYIDHLPAEAPANA